MKLILNPKHCFISLLTVTFCWANATKSNAQSQQPFLIRNLNTGIDVSGVRKLGFYNIDSIPDLRLYGTPNAPQPNIAKNIPNVAGRYHNFLVDDLILIQTANDADLATLNQNPNQNNNLYYTIRAIQIIKQYYPEVYQKLLLNPSIKSSPRITNSSFNNWINSFSKVVISFNTVSNSIAISGTSLGNVSESIVLNGRMYSVYSNLPVISVNPILIAGNNTTQGSRPIYKRNTAAENYELYLKEGLLHTIVHELIHRVIDIYNSDNSSVYNWIFFGAGRQNSANPMYDFEEILVSRTINDYFRSKGGFSEELLRYYDVADLHRFLKVGSVNINTYLTNIGDKSSFIPYEFKFSILN